MGSPIRVLQIFGELNHGGAESMIMSIYRKIDRKLLQFDFVVHGLEEGKFEAEIREMGGKIYRVPKYSVINHLQYERAWEKILNNNLNYNIIHTHVRSTAAIFLKLAKKYKFTTIAHSHSTSNGTGVKALVKNILQKNINKYTDYFFAPTLESGEWLFGTKLELNNNFFILNNAIETEKYIYNEITRLRKREELNLNDEVIIGHVGNFREVKNHSFLIKIFNEYKKNNKNTKLLLIGDGELRTQIIDQLELLNIKKDVILLGARSDVNELLQVMDILVFPSYYEGLPVSIIEAQASGLPCIISDTITKEVAITKNVKFLSINQSDDYWSKEIIKSINTHTRKNMESEIKGSGYDANEIAKKLQKIYLEI